MKVTAAVHRELVFNRRVRILSQLLAEQMPQGAKVLDVGCGDGTIALLVSQHRPDITITGVDVLVRETTAIPVDKFDGLTLPYDDGSFDVVMFCDVLHHTDDPAVLLREARRVASQAVVLKDHTMDGLLAGPTLRFMDWVGNAPHGVVLPYNYWPEGRWRKAFEDIGLAPRTWINRLDLYPGPAGWLFDRSLHFVARLEPC